MADASDTLAGTVGVAAPDAPVPMQQPPQFSMDQPPASPLDQGRNTAPLASNTGAVSEDPAAQFGGLIPSETSPNNPDVERQYHEAKWRQILDRVGTILGGGETVHITKDADGNIQEVHMPSTTSEKWHRVAAAALGGAAQGLANSRGPGGLANAASAGIQYGLAVPKQEKEDIDAQATAEQKRMTANANNALVHQDIYMKMLNSQMLKTTYDVQSAQLMSDFRDELASSPDAKDFGVINGPEDLQKVMQAHPDFFTSHTDLTLKAAPVPKAGGGVETHAIATNPGDDERPIGKGQRRPEISIDPKTNQPSLVAGDEYSPSEKRGKVRQDKQSTIAQFLGLADKWQDSQTRRDKATQDKVPKTPEEALAMAAQTNDPGEKANYTRLASDMQKQVLQQREAGRSQINTGAGVVPPGTQITDLIKPGSRFSPGTVEGTESQKLASGDATIDQMPKRSGKGAITPAEWTGAAEAYSQRDYGLPYSPVQIEQEKKFFENYKTQGILNGVDKMVGVEGEPGDIGYMDRVIHLAEQAGMGENAPLNSIKNAVKNQLGDTAYKEFNTALGEVQRSLPTLIGNPMLGGGDSDLKLQQAQQMLGQNPTLSNIRGQSQVLKDMLNGTLKSMVRNNRYLQRRYPAIMGKASPWIGNTQTNMQQTPPPQQGGAAPPAAPIKWPTTRPPQGEVWVALPGHPPGHIPANAVPAFKTKHPDAQVNQ